MVGRDMGGVSKEEGKAHLVHKFLLELLELLDLRQDLFRRERSNRVIRAHSHCAALLLLSFPLPLALFHLRRRQHPTFRPHPQQRQPRTDALHSLLDLGDRVAEPAGCKVQYEPELVVRFCDLPVVRWQDGGFVFEPGGVVRYGLVEFL